MRSFVFLFLVLCIPPAYAGKCPVYTYIPQPGQHPSGLIELEPAVAKTLLAQLPERFEGKPCWYASTDGTLSVKAPKPTVSYAFRFVEGRWVFAEAFDVITVVGYQLAPNNSFKPTPHRGVGHVPTLR
jgi:hypothetical protein